MISLSNRLMGAGDTSVLPTLNITRGSRDETYFGPSTLRNRYSYSFDLDVGAAEVGRRIWVLMIPIGLESSGPALTVDGEPATYIDHAASAAAFYLDSDTISGTVTFTYTSPTAFLEVATQLYYTTGHSVFNAAADRGFPTSVTVPVDLYEGGAVVACGVSGNTSSYSVTAPQSLTVFVDDQELRSGELCDFVENLSTTAEQNAEFTATSGATSGTNATILVLSIR